MTRNKKIIVILFVIVILLTGAWFSLDSHTKNSLYRATLCKLIYGKNICNFYEMMDIISTNSETSNFEKAMQLCREMENVPKKDSCFEYIAQVVSFYDVEKAKQACDEIKEFDKVHSKDNCYKMVEKSIEERLAESAMIAFMEGRLQRDSEMALIWLTDNAKEQYSQPELTLIGTSNPHFASYKSLETEKLDTEGFKFKVRIYEEYIDQGMVGYFDEILTVVKGNNQYLIDSVERDGYVNF